jgi:ribosome-associated protein
VLTTIHARGHARAGSEGMRQGDWVLIDAGDIIVHLFRPEVRSFYNLEKMWGADFSEAGGASS